MKKLLIILAVLMSAISCEYNDSYLVKAHIPLSMAQRYIYMNEKITRTILLHQQTMAAVFNPDLALTKFHPHGGIGDKYKR